MTQQPPFISYQRGDPVEAARQEEASPKAIPMTQARVFLDAVFKVVTWTILAVVLLAWLVIGVVFWIPWVLRATFLFLVSLVESTFQGLKPTAAAKALRDAVNFYRRGFVVAYEGVMKEEMEESTIPPPEAGRLTFEIFWSILVWYVVLLWLGVIQTSPLDMVNWVVALPWRGVMDSFFAWLSGVGGEVGT